MAREATSYEVLGKPLAKTGPGTLAMTQGDYHSVLAELGVTPEVRETVAAAEEKLANATFEVIRNYIPEANKEHKARIKEAEAAVKAGTANGSQQHLAELKPAPEITVNLGSGDGKMICSVATKVEHTGHNPHTKEPVHTVRFGVPKIAVRHAVPKALESEDGVLAKIKADCEAMFGK